MTYISTTLVTILSCLAVASDAADSAPMCQGALSTASWCDLKKSFDDRAAALVANLTAEEKGRLFVSPLTTRNLGGVPRLAIPPYDWWSEALHGVAGGPATGKERNATSWPEPIGVASTFNKTLFYALGELTSSEARGVNSGFGKTYWAPNINNFRDPRWGRGQETPGEDPLLTSEYAVQFVLGMQGNHPKYLKVSACLKHFAAYSQETGRVGFAAQVLAQDMEDTYLPGFEAGVKQGRASGIMCSYAAETYGYGILGNGSAEQHGAIPSCANKYLMNDLAREKWGFDGYVTSDCGAADYAHGAHQYGNTTFETATAELTAGMDVDCGSDTGILSNASIIPWLTNASTSHIFTPLVDTALHRMFKVQMRLGQFDPPGAVPWSNYTRANSVNTPAHIALAKAAARQGLVLLKNSASTLPLAHSETVAVVGPHAKATIAMLGNYHGGTPFIISPCEGIGRFANTTCPVPSDCKVGSGSCYDEQVAQAIAEASTIVAILGLDGTIEAEGRDKTTLLLPQNQTDDLAKILKAANGKPVILLIMSGSAVDLKALSDNPGISAIAWVGYPGQSGGDAIAEALFDASSNSWGKLPMTWYAEEYLSQVNLSDYRMRPDSSTGYPGRSHRFFTGTPRYPFGYGLTYARFSSTLEILDQHDGFGRGLVAVPANFTDDMVALWVQVNVTNTGSVDGDEVVLLFASPPQKAIDLGAPRQELVAFSRTAVKAGETMAVQLFVTFKQLQLPDQIGEGLWHLRLGTKASPSSVRTFQLV